MGVTTLDGAGAVSAKSRFQAGWNVESAKPCDCCSSAAALIFCRADTAFICLACDARLHAIADKHERVWICDVCRRAPASVTCMADAAALCVACDRDIHYANPLARRHDRASVVPFYDTAVALLTPAADNNMFADNADGKLETLIPDSWISTNPIMATTKFPAGNPDIKPELILSDSDQFLDFDTHQICSQPYNDSLVPVQTTIKPPVQPQLTDENFPENRFEIDFTKSNMLNLYSNSYTTPSLSQDVSSSSMDVGIVPDRGGGAVSESSYPSARTISSIDLTVNQGSQAVGMDREARVLRYKEKRKNRKFGKTIRYASRKAYAETRPRINGRFAKRTDSESDIYGIFGTSGGDFVANARYGVVQSF